MEGGGDLGSYPANRLRIGRKPNLRSLDIMSQRRSDGEYMGIYTPKKLPKVNFLWGKNDVRTAIQQFYTPPPKKNKNFHTPTKQISGYAPDKSDALTTTPPSRADKSASCRLFSISLFISVAS